MKTLTRIGLLFVSILLIQCHKPGVKVSSLTALPETLQDGWNSQRWYFQNVEIDTPLIILKEKKINNVATHSLFKIADRLFFTTFNGFLMAVDLKLNDVDRKKLARGITAPPAFLRPLIFISSEKNDYGLQAYDVTTRKTIWRLKKNFSKSSPLILTDMIVHATTQGKILGLNPLNGKEIWSYHLGQNIYQNLAGTKNVIVACSNDGLLAVINQDDGQVEYLTDLPAHVYTAPLILDQAIYVADYSGNLLKIALADGQISKQIHLGFPFYQPFSTDGKHLFIMGSNGTLFVFTPNLKLIFSVPLKGVPTMPVLVTSNRLLVATYQKKLYLINKKQGTIDQQVDLKFRVVGISPIISNKIYLMAGYNKIILAQLQKGKTK